MTAHQPIPPTWLDGRNPDWERATARELPDLTPSWPDDRAQRRIDRYLVALALFAAPILLWQLLERL